MEVVVQEPTISPTVLNGVLTAAAVWKLLKEELDTGSVPVSVAGEGERKRSDGSF